METLRLIGYALRQHCKHEQDYTLPWWDRWILTAKCIVSLLLGIVAPDGYARTVTVAHFNWRRTFDGEFSGAAGEVLLVARQGMGARVISDGWP